MLRVGEGSPWREIPPCAQDDSEEDCEVCENYEVSNVLLHLSLRSQSKGG